MYLFWAFKIGFWAKWQWNCYFRGNFGKHVFCVEPLAFTAGYQFWSEISLKCAVLFADGFKEKAPVGSLWISLDQIFIKSEHFPCLKKGKWKVWRNLSSVWKVSTFPLSKCPSIFYQTRPLSSFKGTTSHWTLEASWQKLGRCWTQVTSTFSTVGKCQTLSGWRFVHLCSLFFFRFVNIVCQNKNCCMPFSLKTNSQQQSG